MSPKPRLVVAAPGDGPNAQAQARGKLFERLVSTYLTLMGYKELDLRVKYAGMEIDVEGTHGVTGHRLYAECKCYSDPVDSPMLQAFYGKYMLRWQKDSRCEGLFVALRGLNGSALGLYRDEIVPAPSGTVALKTGEDVTDALEQSGEVSFPPEMSPIIGSVGESELLYTDKGIFFIRYVIPSGSGVASAFALYDSKGNVTDDEPTASFVRTAHPTLRDFSILDAVSTGESVPAAPVKPPLVVEVIKSSAPFEYQFPASPEFFVGRRDARAAVSAFADAVLMGKTNNRSLLLHANSGWGKSSFILAIAQDLTEKGHCVVALDTRTADSAQYAMAVVRYVLDKFGRQMSDAGGTNAITGFVGAADRLVSLGERLGAQNRLLVVFLDQFEGVFNYPELLRHLRDMVLRLQESGAKVILGFSWKTDMVGSTHDFPYQMRDDIETASRQFHLDAFSQVETDGMLTQLEKELGRQLRRDLRFLLSEFSQGYPWLLKKLCAHVLTQCQGGETQANMANRLNVKQLFDEDLAGLAPKELEALRRVAGSGPLSAGDLEQEGLSADLLESLIHRRLLVRVGTKYHVYWDIFRDYLVTGALPVSENYLLRVSAGCAMAALKSLAEHGGTMDVSAFQKATHRKGGSYFNLVRDLRLMGLAELSGQDVVLKVPYAAEGPDRQRLRDHLQDRMRRNRMARRVVDKLGSVAGVSLQAIALLLKESCPYVTAIDKTWLLYAKCLAGWLDAADLAIWDRLQKLLRNYDSTKGLRDRALWVASRRMDVSTPRVQYSAILRVADRLAQARLTGGGINLRDISRSTVSKSLWTMEDMGFIDRVPTGLIFTKLGLVFIDDKSRRDDLFRTTALKNPIYSQFVDLLGKHGATGVSNSTLAAELKQVLRCEWRDGTARTAVKIMMNWARLLGQIPAGYRKLAKPLAKRPDSHGMMPLFPETPHDGRDGQSD